MGDSNSIRFQHHVRMLDMRGIDKHHTQALNGKRKHYVWGSIGDSNSIRFQHHVRMLDMRGIDKHHTQALDGKW